MQIPVFLNEVLGMWKIALPAMFIGCFCGILFRTGKYFEIISRFTAPMVKMGKLPKSLGLFFILCLLNRYAANAMLAEHYKEKTISLKSLIAVYLMGTFPTGIYFTIFNFSPLLISNLGWELGMKFIAINLSFSVIITVIGFWMNRMMTGEIKDTYAIAQAEAEATNYQVALTKAVKQFYGISVIFMPITLFFGFLVHTDFIAFLISQIDPFLKTFNLAASGILVIIAGIPTVMAAIGVAGTLLANGSLPESLVILMLLFASFFHNVYDGLTRIWPTNASIFGVQVGTMVSIIGTGLYLLMVACGIIIAYGVL